MNPVIETRNLLKTYRADRVAVEALRGVDLRVAPGEFVAVMGPSGCGKSTLLHLLGGLDRPTAGEVVVAGQRLDALSESARAVMRRETVGFVFQAYNLIPNLTVADNVDLPGLLAGHPPVEVAARREELLEALGLADKERAFPGELSGGQQQRAAIARALVNRPAVLLADEPTGNLDSRSGAEVLALLRRFHAEGQTTVLVTHDAKVASFAGRVIFMRDGQLVDEARLTAPGDAATVLSRLVQLEL
jgi:putative ABC transport system ATP-binding protein